MNTDEAIKEATERRLLQRIRLLLWITILGLVVSGATAIPLESELRLLSQWSGNSSGFGKWVTRVYEALAETNAKYPFIAYGTDLLAFAHFVIAIAFIGPLRNPEKNVWVVEFGIIGCALVVPFALCAGGMRGIPLGWRLIDCSFGVLGIIPLWICRNYVRRLEQSRSPTPIR